MKSVYRRAVLATTALGLGAGLAGGFGAAVLPGVPALLSAHAAPSATNSLEYRLDGGNWSSVAPALFPSTWIPVPGGSVAATLEIRSNRAGTTVIAVYVGSAHSNSSDVLASTTFISPSVSTRLSDLATAGGTRDACALVLPQTVLKQGESISIPASLAMSGDLKSGQNASLSFGLLITASDTGPTVLPNGCPIDPAIISAFPIPDGSPASTILQRTGSAPDPSILWWGSAIVTAMGAGLGLSGTRRRHRHGGPGVAQPGANAPSRD